MWLLDRSINIPCRINDLNQDVYCFWKTLQDNPNQLINAITRIKKGCKDGRRLYRKMASAKTSGVFSRALRFYILNRISFSGTVDSGGYSAEAFEKRFTLSRIKALRPLAGLLENVEITGKSYEQLLSEGGKNVFIFLDPPYWNARKFPLYGKNGDLNKSFDHTAFAENVKNCKHKWLTTCDDSPVIRSLFSSFAHINIIQWEMQYGMNKKKAIKGKELFITNCEPQQSVQTELASPEVGICSKTMKHG